MTTHRKHTDVRGRTAVPAAMQALFHERRRQARERSDGSREGMPASLQARDNLRRELDAG